MENTNQKHLTLEDRNYIEQTLNQNIARHSPFSIIRNNSQNQFSRSNSQNSSRNTSEDSL